MQEKKLYTNNKLYAIIYIYILKAEQKFKDKMEKVFRAQPIMMEEIKKPFKICLQIEQNINFSSFCFFYVIFFSSVKLDI